MRQSELREFSPTGVECPTCGRDDFASEQGMKCHHTKIHGESIAGVVFECDWCGDESRRSPGHIHEDMNNFCSMECRGKYRSEHFVGEDSSRWDGGKVELTCASCGDSYTKSPSRTNESRFCSRECQGEWQSEHWVGDHWQQWSGGTVTVECDACGGDFSEYPSDAERRRFCSRACYDEWQTGRLTGQDHPRWRGGKSIYDAVKKQLPGLPWRAQREKAKELDDRACQMCGDTDSRIDSHHIIPVMAGGTNELWDLTTLCEVCHGKVERYTWQIPEINPVLTE